VHPKNSNYVDLLYQDLNSLQFIAVLLNGNMRTPKIEALYRGAAAIQVKWCKAGIEHMSLIVPTVIYNDMDSDKKRAVYENKGKSGIYRIINLTNENAYIGSSVCLDRRFASYYSFKFIDRRQTSLICKALLKYGYSKFRLEVIEYCPVENLLQREQYYLDLLKPKYNILTTAGSSLGYKHTKETIAKFKLRKHSEDTLEKFKAKTFSEEHRAKISVANCSKVLVVDLLTNNHSEYDSIRKAAEELGAPYSTIRYYALKGKLYLDKYKITIIEK